MIIDVAIGVVLGILLLIPVLHGIWAVFFMPAHYIATASLFTALCGLTVSLSILAAMIYGLFYVVSGGAIP